jgi:hypothetical protein
MNAQFAGDWAGVNIDADGLTDRTGPACSAMSLAKPPAAAVADPCPSAGSDRKNVPT